jgi:hypothetical protein
LLKFRNDDEHEREHDDGRDDDNEHDDESGNAPGSGRLRDRHFDRCQRCENRDTYL